MNYLELARTLIQLLPIVMQAVQAVEDAMGPGNGKVKLELVKTTIQSAYDVSNTTVGAFAAVWPALETVISGIVTAKKAVAAVAGK